MERGDASLLGCNKKKVLPHTTMRIYILKNRCSQNTRADYFQRRLTCRSLSDPLTFYTVMALKEVHFLIKQHLLSRDFGLRGHSLSQPGHGAGERHSHPDSHTVGALSLVHHCHIQRAATQKWLELIGCFVTVAGLMFPRQTASSNFSLLLSDVSWCWSWHIFLTPGSDRISSRFFVVVFLVW